LSFYPLTFRFNRPLKFDTDPSTYREHPPLPDCPLLVLKEFLSLVSGSLDFRQSYVDYGLKFSGANLLDNSLHGGESTCFQELSIEIVSLWGMLS